MSKKENPSCEKFEARNWKEVSKKELLKMTPIQKSRYLAYEKSADQKGIKKCQSRVNEHIKSIKLAQKKDQLSKLDYHEIQNISGDINSQEAMLRLQRKFECYHKDRKSEICHLITMQPTAIKAVRLENLLPCENSSVKLYDTVGKNERRRIETLMEDTLGIETSRIVCS